MSQSRALSAVEALANVAIGWLVALATQLVVFPTVGLQATAAQNVTVSTAFTAVSLIRSYVLRRVFEAIARRKQGGRVNLWSLSIRDRRGEQNSRAAVIPTGGRIG